MKKMILAACCLLTPFLLRASGNGSIWAGYSYSFMENANAVLSNYLDAQTSAIKLGNGVTAGVDGGYWYYSWWGIGGRISKTILIDGVAEGTESGIPAKLTAGGDFLQLSAGIPVLFEIFDGKMSASGGAYAGWGLASIALNKTGGISGGRIIADGACFVMEIPAKITYHFSSSFLLDLNFSWKSAHASEFFARENSNFEGYNYKKGERVYIKRSMIPEDPYFDMDFSGVMIGLGFNWRFSSKDWPWYNKKFSLTE